MTTLEWIAATFVAIVGVWLTWPCLLVTAILTFLMMWFATGIVYDHWLTWRERRKKHGSQVNRK